MFNTPLTCPRAPYLDPPPGHAAWTGRCWASLGCLVPPLRSSLVVLTPASRLDRASEETSFVLDAWQGSPNKQFFFKFIQNKILLDCVN